MSPKTSLEIQKRTISLYQEGLSIDKIRKKLGIGKNNVHRILKRHNVKIRTKGGRYKLSIDQKKEIKKLYESGVNSGVLCKQFGCAYSTLRSAIKELGGKTTRCGCQKKELTKEDIDDIIFLYKSGYSQTKIANKYGMGQSTISSLLIKNNISIRKNRGKYGNMYNGGRHLNNQGYVLVLLDNNDPYYCMTNSSSYVLEHRLVMARFLGRPLTKNETVHHVDGNRTNNKIENLQLRHGQHGKGVCCKCLDCGSFNVKITHV